MQSVCINQWTIALAAAGVISMASAVHAQESFMKKGVQENVLPPQRIKKSPRLKATRRH